MKRLAAGAIAEKTCAQTGEIPVGFVRGHAWGSFGEGDGIGFAVAVMGVRCSPRSTLAAEDHAGPTEKALLSPGGASPAELTALSPQRADEIFNRRAMPRAVRCG